MTPIEQVRMGILSPTLPGSAAAGALSALAIVAADIECVDCHKSFDPTGSLMGDQGQCQDCWEKHCDDAWWKQHQKLAAKMEALRELGITDTIARTLASLLGQYQGFLEDAIHNELIPAGDGEWNEPADPEIRRRVNRDRRRWRACEDFQHLLAIEEAEGKAVQG